VENDLQLRGSHESSPPCSTLSGDCYSVCVNHVTRMNEAYHTCEYVMAHVRMGHVTHVHASSHTFECGILSGDCSSVCVGLFCRTNYRALLQNIVSFMGFFCRKSSLLWGSFAENRLFYGALLQNIVAFMGFFCRISSLLWGSVAEYRLFYGVLLQNIVSFMGFFCRISSLLWGSFAKGIFSGDCHSVYDSFMCDVIDSCV